MQQDVRIYDEFGAHLVATGVTTDGGATVTQLSGPVAVHQEYQRQVGNGPRVGVMCTAYNAATTTAHFA
jgi:hypothetical protein